MGVIDVRGLMVMESVDVCDAWETKQRIRLTFLRPDTEEFVTDSAFTSFEAKDGSSMQFSVRNTQNGEVEEELAIPATTALDGLSFLDLLEDPDAIPPRDRILVERFSPSGFAPTRIDRALHDGTYKYVLHDNELGSTEEFYRIASDPWEEIDLRRSGTWTPEEEAIFYELQEELVLLLQS